MYRTCILYNSSSLDEMRFKLYFEAFCAKRNIPEISEKVTETVEVVNLQGVLL